MIEPLHDYRIEVLHGYKNEEGDITKVLGEIGAEQIVEKLNQIIEVQHKGLELLHATQVTTDKELKQLEARLAMLERVI